MASFIQAYKEAFLRCYPDKEIEVRPKRFRDEIRFNVLINGQSGDVPLSESDMRDATRMFNRGK